MSYTYTYKDTYKVDELLIEHLMQLSNTGKKS